MRHINSSAWRNQVPQRSDAPLPAFCRSRRTTVMVTASSLSKLQNLLVLLLLFQLSTLLLVIAGPVPPSQLPANSTAIKQ